MGFVLYVLKLYSEKTDSIDDSLETDIKSYYLIIFSKLFLSGDYDSYFDKNTFNLNIDNLEGI